MRDALAIMISMTTHGTSLDDEERRWVDQDVIMPAEPVRHPPNGQGGNTGPLAFSRDQLKQVGSLIGAALRDELGLRIWALTVQSWYAHLVVGATREPTARIVRCAEDAVRRGLGWKRPIWGDGYVKRFCVDEESVRQRIAYVERNNIAVDWPAKPWPFIETPGF